MISRLEPFLLFLVLLCMQCKFVYISGETRCIEREREALMAFKQGLVDEFGVLTVSSWGSEDGKKECCSWLGVECSNVTGNVISLQIYPYNSSSDRRKSRGVITPTLLELNHLSYLEITYIDFGGNRIPEFMGSMKTLQSLSLIDCNLFGIVPQQLGNLTNLVTLDLSHNSLSFENLNWLSHLSSLSNLDLSGNNVSDANWPQQMLSLRSLHNLRLDRCELRDGTPSKDSFMNLTSTSLSSVELSQNYLTLATLDWLLSIRSLVSIQVCVNHLNGLIPDSIKNLTFLDKLDLSYNKLEGRISKSLWGLSHLSFLDLSHNNLRDPLMESIGNLSCKALEYLILRDNHLSGFVPEFSSCIRLRELVLGNNKLQGLPPSFAHLSKLKELDVSNNSLEGTISEATFMKLYNLKELDLSLNDALHVSSHWNPTFQLKTLFLRGLKLGPKFPTWLQSQRDLSRLDLSCTGITDEAPYWLWNFSSSLSYLQLSRNKISGTIHNIYSEYHSTIVVAANASSAPLLESYRTGVRVLQLSQNTFTGSITSICNMYNLIVLDISYNHLSGELPTCWKNMNELRVLNLAGNIFSGEIPHSLGFLQGLTLLHLNDNKFSGELPPTLRNCQYLHLIDVGGNKLTGDIPQWIGANYTYMKYLILRQNGFTGNIPQEICKFTRIQILDISRNNLSGKIPGCFSNFASLGQVDKTPRSGIISLVINFLENDLWGISRIYNDYAYVSVQWKRKEWEHRNTLGLLKLIDLSSNELIGNIPRELLSLKGLVSLNLSRNCLQGSIHPDIGLLKMIESLDLSRNVLSGEIPTSMAELHYLQVLDLSHNNLSGQIPIGTQLQSFNESAFVGNAQLCGKPLQLCLRNNLNRPTSKPGGDDEESNWFISLSFTQDLCISMAFGFIFGFSGVIGTLRLIRCWRIPYLNSFGSIGH